MDFLPPVIDAYAEAHTEPESALLQRIDRETHLEVLRPRMLSGHLQGRVLSLLSRMQRPQRILEIGTYTAYSAICLAEGLQPGGTLITIDLNEELEERVRGYLAEAGLTDKVDYRVGDALEIIPSLEGPFDLVFIDADKENYLHYYEMVIGKMPSGALLIADNVLWSGKVTGDYETLDKDTRAIVDFNRALRNDDRVRTLLLPVRDGLLIVEKK